MILNVVEAEYISGYKIKLRFNNGKTKIINLKETIFNDKREIFKPLRNIEYFKEFKIKLNTISWQNGLDLAPEYLYELTVSNKYQNV